MTFKDPSLALSSFHIVVHCGLHYGTLWIVDSTTPYFDNNDDDINDISFSVEFHKANVLDTSVI